MDSAILAKAERQSIEEELTNIELCVGSLRSLLHKKVLDLPATRNKMCWMLEHVNSIMWKLPD